MSAPSNAIPLRNEKWEDENHKTLYDFSVSCSCGWTGSLLDLLCDPDDPKPSTNDFWCPQCRSRGWSFD